MNQSQAQNQIEQNRQNHFQKNDALSRSSCSIQKNPYSSSKNVQFRQNQNQSDFPYIKSNKSIIGLNKNKEKNTYSDRYLPIRNIPRSAKELYNEQIEWIQNSDEQQQTQQTHKSKGLSIADIYKMELLGGTPNKNGKQTVIQSYINPNLLKFNNKGDDILKDSKNINSMFHHQLKVSIPQHYIPTPTKKDRKINKIPTKVLDAPALYDDFYLNLVDWSHSNILSVGLSNSVYLWNANNSKVVRLLELNSNDLVTGVAWSLSSSILGVGTHSGTVQLWDANKSRKVSTYQGHGSRVGSIAWNSNNLFASGSRDKNILIRDLRKNDPYVMKMIGHKQEVCGLRWSFDQQQLASGGNDNRLCLWNLHSPTPVYNIMKHSAAVKALAWSPHQHGLLVTGGGTADRTIRFWNSISGQETSCLNVGSQVCNLMFSKTVNQLVSTHGYSLNEINIWRMPQMQKIQTLTGHTYRVLYLAMNPDGTTIVTGAGDQTLRFWNVFPKKQKVTRNQSSLNPDAVRLR